MLHRQLTRAALFVTSALNNNSLTGPIPDSLGSLTALWYLCVRAGTASRWVATADKSVPLARSDLMGNSLSGSIPDSMSNLTTLYYLCVRAGAALSHWLTSFHMTAACPTAVSAGRIQSS